MSCSRTQYTDIAQGHNTLIQQRIELRIFVSRNRLLVSMTDIPLRWLFDIATVLAVGKPKIHNTETLVISTEHKTSH